MLGIIIDNVQQIKSFSVFGGLLAATFIINVVHMQMSIFIKHATGCDAYCS